MAGNDGTPPEHFRNSPKKIIRNDAEANEQDIA